MGEVWSGVHRHTELPIAAKVLTAVRARSPRAKEAFAREVQAMAGLDHPGIVMAFDTCEVSAEAEEASSRRLTAGSPALAMELATGSLRSDVGVANWHRVRDLLLAILDALAHAHARGVVHRDLKPSNVLVFGDGRIKLCDFGIAWSLEGVSPLLRAGSAPYMAPEQVRGAWREYGPWTDLYGLGCTAWHLIMSQTPFSSTTDPGEVLDAHLHEPVPELRPATPFPPGFEDWLRTLLCKDPANRYQTAAEAARALLPLGEASDPVRGGEVALEDWRQPWVRPSMKLIGAGLGLYGLRRPPLAGREHERETLWRALGRVCEHGRVEAVVLRGAAGTGKTRLARWLCERAAELGIASTLRAIHGERSGPAHGLEAMVVRRLRCQLLERHEVAARIRHLFAWDAEEVGALTELVSPLPKNGHPHGVRTVKLEGTSDRLQILQRLVEAVASRRPVILWVDDAQWGEEALALAESLMPHPMPVLIVLTARQEALEQRPGADAKLTALLDEHSGTQDLPVSPLVGRERTELISGLLGLAGELATEVDERTAGNPLFAVQLVGDWVQRGVLEAGETGWQLRPGASVPLPDDLHELWTRRIDHLLQGRPESDRFALELAAVLGKEVSDAEWGAASAAADIGVPDGLLQEMLARDLAISDEVDGWSFVHGMLCESLMRMASEAGRAAKHGDDCSAGLVTLGREAMRDGISLRRTVADFERAADLSCSPAPRAIARTQLATALSRQGHLGPARMHLDTSLPVHREAGNRNEEAQCRVALAHLDREDGQFDTAEKHCLAALASFREEGARGGEASAYCQLGLLALYQGRLDDARASYEAAISLWRELGDEPGEAFQLLNLGTLHRRAGRLPLARASFDAALAIHEKLGDRHGEGLTRNCLANLHLQQGNLKEAVAQYDLGLAIAREVGNRSSEGVILGNLGAVSVHLGNHEVAEAHLLEALAIHRELGVRQCENDVLTNLGELYLNTGRRHDAAATLAAALDLARERNDSRRAGSLLATTARLHNENDELEPARRCIDEALELLRGCDDPHLLANALCDQVRIEVRDDRALAERVLEEATQIAVTIEAGEESYLGKALRKAREELAG